MKKIIFILSIIYSFIVFVYSFFKDTFLNIFFTNTMFGVYLTSFPIFIGVFFSIISILVLIIYYNKKRILLKSFIIILMSSVVFIVFSNNFEKKESEKIQDSIKILEWNALSSFDEETAKIILKELDVDIVVLPEYGTNLEYTVERLKKIFKKLKINFNDYNVYVSNGYTGEGIEAVTIIMKKSLGDYDVIDDYETRFGTVYLKSKTNLPDIIALHTAPPIPFLFDVWKKDIKLVYNMTKKYKNSIILGDFNATLRHSYLNSIDTHKDVLDYLPKFSRGTWNVKMNKYFRASIDHILVPNEVDVKEVKIIDLKKSDHLGIFTEIFITK